VALVERQEEHPEPEAEGEDDTDHRVALAAADAHPADQPGDDERAGDQADDRVDSDQERAGRAGEAELGDPVDGERHVAGHDERPDETGHDRDDRAGDEGVLDEALAEQVDQGRAGHRWKAGSGSLKSECSGSPPSVSGSPTTTMRPRTRRTSTGER